MCVCVFVQVRLCCGCVCVVCELCTNNESTQAQMCQCLFLYEEHNANTQAIQMCDVVGWQFWLTKQKKIGTWMWYARNQVNSAGPRPTGSDGIYLECIQIGRMAPMAGTNLPGSNRSTRRDHCTSYQFRSTNHAFLRRLVGYRLKPGSGVDVCLRERVSRC